MTEQRRLEAPWGVEENEESFVVRTKNGIPVSYHYFSDDPERRFHMQRLSRDEARRVAYNVAKLPDLLAKKGDE